MELRRRSKQHKIDFEKLSELSETVAQQIVELDEKTKKARTILLELNKAAERARMARRSQTW